jgi:hypothetical protein
MAFVSSPTFVQLFVGVIITDVHDFADQVRCAGNDDKTTRNGSGGRRGHVLTAYPVVASKFP